MKVSRLLLDALETFPNFVIIDKNAKIVYLNDSYANLLGISQEHAIGQPVVDYSRHTHGRNLKNRETGNRTPDDIVRSHKTTGYHNRM